MTSFTIGFMKPFLVAKDPEFKRDEQIARAEFLTEREVCQRLGVALTTLRRWRWEGREMPSSIRMGKLVRYHRPEVEAWIQRVVSGEVKAGIRPAGLVS